NELDSDYLIKPFQKSCPQQQNQSVKMDRIESKVDEIGQMTSQFGRIMLDNQSKKPVAKSNFTCYYLQLPSIQSQYTFSASDNKKDNNADKPSDFAIKSNSKHISELLGWYTNVPISVKNKNGKVVTATGNFAHINNSEPEPIKALVAKDPPKEKQILEGLYDSIQVSTNSSSLTSEDDLKKSAKSLKSVS
ncbi:15641_t:CDS:2, partial [Cetraspora pellucida]